jgi:hypothetical protein
MHNGPGRNEISKTDGNGHDYRDTKSLKDLSLRGLGRRGQAREPKTSSCNVLY